MSADVVRMRGDYAALLRVVDGLPEMIHRGQACNIITFSRMAEEARSAARHLASEIERLLFGVPQESRAPDRKRGILDVVRGIARAVIAAVSALAS